MAAELKARISIDTAPFVGAIEAITRQSKDAASAITAIFGGSLKAPDTKAASAAYSALSRAASETVTEQKQALASLIASGQQGSEAYEAVKQQLLEATKEARKLDEAMEAVNKEVADVNDKPLTLGDKLKGGFSDAFAGGAIGGLIGGGIAGAVQSGLGAITGAFASAIQLGQEFETSLQSVSAVTGATGPALDDLAGRARDLSKQFGGSASDQLGVFGVTLSKIGPQLAQAPEALGKFAENVNLLGKTDAALGATGAVEALSNTMLQFGIDTNNSAEVAAQSTRIINILAASAGVGSASVGDVSSAISVVGATANNANVSIEETAAALQVLASKSLVGSSAGTALTAVLVKLQSLPADANEALKGLGTSSQELGEILTTKGLGPAIARLRTAMEGLGSQAEKNALLNKLFGEGGQNAAAALLGGGEMLEQFTKGVTGTNAAAEQAATNMDTLAERISRAKAVVEDGLLSAFQAIGPVISSALDNILPTLLQAFSDLGTALAPVVKVIGTVLGATIFAAIKIAVGAFAVLADTVKTLGPLILVAAAGFAAYTAIQNASAIATALATAKQWLLNAAMAANPFGAVVAVIGALAVGYSVLNKSMGEVVQESLDEAEAAKKLTEQRIKDNSEKQKSVATTKSLASEFQSLAARTNRTADENKRLQEIQRELDRQYPDLIDQTKSFADNLKGVEEIGRRTTSEMGKLTDQATKLGQQLEQQTKQIGFLKRNVAIQAVLDFDVDGLDSNSIFEPVRKRFAEALFKATTDADVERAYSEILDFINKNANRIVESSEEQLQLNNLVGEAYKAQLAALAGTRKATTEINSQQKQGAQEAQQAAKKEEADTESAFQKAKKAYEERSRLINDEIALLEVKFNREAAAAGREKLSDEETKKLAEEKLKKERERESVLRSIFKIKTNEEGLVVGIGFGAGKGEVQKQLVADVRGLLVGVEKSVSGLLLNIGGIDAKALSKDLKEFEKQVKDQTGNLGKVIKETITVETFIDSRDSFDDTLKSFDQSIAALRAEISRRLAETTDKGARETLQGLLFSVNKQATEGFNAAVEAIRKSSKELLTVDDFVKDSFEFTATRAAIIDRFGKLRAALTAELATLVDKDAIADVQARLALLAKVEAGFEKETAQTAEKGRIEALRKAANLETDARKRQLLLEELEIDEKFRKQLEAVQGNAEREAQIEAEKAKAIAKIREEYELDTSVEARAQKALADTITAGFENAFAEKEKAASEDTEKQRQELAKQQADLRASYKNGEIATAEYQAKRAELAREATELAAEQSILDVVLGTAKKDSIKFFEKELLKAAGKAQAAFAELAESGEASFAQLGIAVAATIGAGLGEAARQGELSVTSVLQSVARAASSALDLLAPIISAQFLAFLGPLAAPLALVAIGTLKALLQGAIAGIGAEKGVIGITADYKVRPGPTDTIPIMIAPGEAVINKRSTSNFADVLSEINSRNSLSAATVLKHIDLKEIVRAIPGEQLVRELKLDKLGITLSADMKPTFDTEAMRKMALDHPAVHTLQLHNETLKAELSRVSESMDAMRAETQGLRQEVRGLRGSIAGRFDVQVEATSDPNQIFTLTQKRAHFDVNRL